VTKTTAASQTIGYFRASDFTRPEDRAAREQFEVIPGFTPALRAFMRVLPAQLLHSLNMAQKIRLGPRQLPKVYRYLPPTGDCRAGVLPRNEPVAQWLHLQ